MEKDFILVEDGAYKFDMHNDLKVLYHDKDMPKLEFIGGEEKSDCIDLYTAEEITLQPGESGMINLGITVKAPRGFRCNLYPRSSTFKKFGIVQTNSIGIIDNSYSGAGDIWRMPVLKPVTDKDYNVRPINIGGDFSPNFIDVMEFIGKPITIPKHTRIAQLELIPIVKGSNLKEVSIENWVGTNRGGFGSTD